MPTHWLALTPSTSESIEEALRADELGDGSRESRLRCRKEWHEREREAAEIRAKAFDASRRKAELEEAAQAEALEPRYFQELSTSSQNNDCVRADVEALRKVVPAADFVSFVADTVMIRMTYQNSFKDMKLKFQYTQGFPKEPVLIELEAQRLDQELVQKLQTAAHSKVAALATDDGQGTTQAKEAYELISHFMATNRLATAFSDIKQIKQLCSTTDCELKHHWDRKGAVEIELREEKYFMDLRLVIDGDYPSSATRLEVLKHNLPVELEALYAVQAKQKASQLAEPPHVIGVGLDGSMARAGAGCGTGSKNARKAQARQTMSSAKIANNLVARSHDLAEEVQKKQQQLLHSFSSQPSLWPVVNFLYADCLLPLVRDRCSVCGKHVIPTDPSKCALVKRPMAPERLYCGHLYHSHCLEEYIQNPPFDKVSEQPFPLTVVHGWLHMSWMGLPVSIRAQKSSYFSHSSDNLLFVGRFIVYVFVCLSVHR